MADQENHEAERAMREAEVPYIKSEDELIAYIRDLLDRPHDYGTAVYAMSMAAVAAFNYAAHQVGASGFQASCADLDILRRTRGMERFTIVNIGDALYPQYDLPGRLAETLKEAEPWLASEARRRLAENETAHPKVIAHWQKLAAHHPEPEAA
jgi:hypothetical protein